MSVFDITEAVVAPGGVEYDAPDIQFWYHDGIMNGATHLIIMFDGGGPLEPYYAMPDEDYLDVQGQLEGGGHCWRVIDLTVPLSEKDINDFCKLI